MQVLVEGNRIVGCGAATVREVPPCGKGDRVSGHRAASEVALKLPAPEEPARVARARQGARFQPQRRPAVRPTFRE